jgi:diacylglycerol kinase (ATP)
MMRATLFHNPGAGREQTDLEHIVTQLAKHGFSTRAVSTKTDACQAGLQDPGDLAVVVGGDGTAGKIALRLRGTGVPLLILPSGTANNIAKSLGMDSSPEKLVARLASASRRQLDVGTVSGAGGESVFLEASGSGLFTRAMHAANGQSKTPTEALALLRKLAESFPGEELRIRFGGHDLHDMYLMVEIMNFPLMGPNLRLAPSADPGDGRLNLVLVPARMRAPLLKYLDDLLAGNHPEPDFPVYPVEQVELRSLEPMFHIDDEPYPQDRTRILSEGTAGDFHLQVGLLPGAVEVLVL